MSMIKQVVGLVRNTFRSSSSNTMATSYQRQQAPPYNNNYESDDGLNTDEEEEERQLSALHGEASDDNGSKKRKRNDNNDTKLTEEDAAAAKEFEEKIRKKIARPQFTPQLLTSGSKGLVYLRRSFPTRVTKFRDAPRNKVTPNMDKRQRDMYNKRRQTSQINMAARYSSSLMSAYTDFARNIFPSLAPTDVFLKIEALGSKNDVKKFLQVMRDDMRKEYMIKLYDGDVKKVERLLNEKADGINAGGVGANALMGVDEDNYQQEVQYDDGATTTARLGVRVDADGVEEEATLPVAQAPVANPYKKNVVVNEATDNADSSPTAEKDLQDKVEVAPMPEKEAEDQIESVTNEQDDEEENEVEFEEEPHEPCEKQLEEDATKDDIIMPDNEEEESQRNELSVDSTQETLTLVESQGDDRFSQADDGDIHFAQASQDEPDREDQEENNERFSQINTSAEEGVDAAQEESFSQEENTLNERFSQVTDRVTFEEGTFSQENDGDEDFQNSAPLGQMTSTQLSMEY